LISTQVDEGETWITFTEAGRAMAATLGITIRADEGTTGPGCRACATGTGHHACGLGRLQKMLRI
jgi:hypothetical protein